MQMRNTCK